MFESTSRSPHGYSVTTSPDGPTVEFDTLQCCHCGKHFNVVRGSGTKRGFCLKCMQVTCGSERCMACLPHEKWIEGVEKGLILP
jgi:hypothetical protein